MIWPAKTAFEWFIGLHRKCQEPNSGISVCSRRLAFAQCARQLLSINADRAEATIVAQIVLALCIAVISDSAATEMHLPRAFGNVVV